MSTIPKIAIAVHSYGFIHPRIYANHISVFCEWAKSFNVCFIPQDRTDVAKARNLLVKSAIFNDCTHILFIDVDHEIESSLLPCLLGNEGAAAVSGLIVKRDGSGIQVGFIEADEHYHHIVDLPQDGNSYDVDACAFGCTLIDLEVFKELEEPYFRDVIKLDQNGKPYQQRSDIKFCADLRKLKKVIRIDTRVIVGHQGEPITYYPETKG